MHWEPKKHHKKALRFALERPFSGLLLDPGLGKTSVMLATQTVLKKSGDVRKSLVLGPLRVVHSVWPGEIRKWDNFRHFKPGVLHGAHKERTLREALQEDKHDIVLLNFEGLEWLYAQLQTLRGRWPFEMLVIDESSKIRNTRTQRYRMLEPMLRYFKRRHILTGSPAPKTLLNLFGQMYACDLGATFGPYFTKYRKTFFYPTGYGGYDWQLKDGADKKIFELLKTRVLRLSADDYLDLPKLIVTNVSVELPKKARAKYDEMEEHLRTQVGMNLVRAANAGVASSKCRQITGGAVFADNGEWREVHEAKLDAVEDLLDEIGGHPVMVVYEYRHELERLQKRFPEGCTYGGPNVKKNLELENAWNRGEVPLLFVQPQSGGHGLNLQFAGYGQIWMTPTWDFELWDQMIRRMYREGRKAPVFIYRILAEDTVDEAVVEACEKKGAQQSNLLDALRHFWKERTP